MDPLVAVLVLGMLSAAAVQTIRSMRQGRRREELHWLKLAEACGLTPHPQWPYLGQKGRLSVHVSTEADGQNTLVALVGGLDLPDGFRVRREGRGMVLARRLGAREMEIGDPAFDAQFFVQGPEVLVRALFDAETRRLCLDKPWQMDFTRDGLKLRIPRPVAVVLSAPAEREIAADDVRAVVSLGERFLRPEDPVPRLCAIVRRDPQPGVRHRCLQTLIREHPDHESTPATLQGALGDTSHDVRLRAAMALGPAGRPTLTALASDGRAPDRCSAEAVEGLGAHLPVERTRELLDESLRAGRPETARACLRALAARRDAAEIGPLASVLAGQSGMLAVAAASALGATGVAAAEPPLLDALGRDEDEVRVAAAEALGHVGSVAAVLPLKEAVTRKGGAGLARAARQAIAEIQERSGGSPGQVSLTSTEAGQLSLADTQHGQVSLTGEVASGDGGARPR